jgi:hypothetical protein
MSNEKARCAWCRKRIQLRTTARIMRVHGPRYQRCRGSGQTPEAITLAVAEREKRNNERIRDIMADIFAEARR